MEHTKGDVVTARIHVNITGVDGEAKAETLRAITAALAVAGFPKVEPPKPPRPNLRVIRGGGDRDQT